MDFVGYMAVLSNKHGYISNPNHDLWVDVKLKPENMGFAPPERGSYDMSQQFLDMTYLLTEHRQYGPHCHGLQGARSAQSPSKKLRRF